MYVWCYSSWRCWFSACLGGMPLNVCSVGIESRPHTHSIKQKQTELQMSPPSFPPVSVCYATARAATTVLFTTLLCKFYRQLQLKWVFVSFDISRNVSISIVRLRNLKTLSMPARRTKHTGIPLVFLVLCLTDGIDKRRALTPITYTFSSLSSLSVCVFESEYK